jgi:hypothetical protein
MDAVTNNVVLW